MGRKSEGSVSAALFAPRSIDVSAGSQGTLDIELYNARGAKVSTLHLEIESAEKLYEAIGEVLYKLTGTKSRG